jgi:hypothetical protein
MTHKADRRQRFAPLHYAEPALQPVLSGCARRKTSLGIFRKIAHGAFVDAARAGAHAGAAAGDVA